MDYRNYRYETEHFILRQVTLEDAPALLKCYSDPAAEARRKVLGELGFDGPEKFRDYNDYYRKD